MHLCKTESLYAEMNDIEYPYSVRVAISHQATRAKSTLTAHEYFLPFIQKYCISVTSDNVTSIHYMNKQGGMWSSHLYTKAVGFGNIPSDQLNSSSVTSLFNQPCQQLQQEYQKVWQFNSIQIQSYYGGVERGDTTCKGEQGGQAWPERGRGSMCDPQVDCGGGSSVTCGCDRGNRHDPWVG